MRRVWSSVLSVFLLVFLLGAPAQARTVSTGKVAATGASHPAMQQADGAPYDADNPPDRLRVLVALGPSTYFLKDGRPHGLEFALLQGFESELNRRRTKGRPPIRLQFIPVDAGELIPALREGRGDIAAGMLPYSDSLKSLIRPTEPYAQDQWCLVSHRDNPLTFDQLGQKALTLNSASYGRRLLAIEGKEVALDEPPQGSNAEMLLRDMNQNPALQSLSSRWVYRLWSATYPSLKLSECLNNTVSLVWGVDQDNVALADDLNRYLGSKNRVTMEKAIELTRRFLISGAQIERSDKISSMDKLAIFAPIFQAAAAANNLDWLLLAAIGQKESKLTPMIRKNGPTGVMQVNPSTARAMGIRDPHGNEGNISAAALYLNYLRKMYSREGISEDNQLYFMIAAYNAGEGRLQQLRRKAKAQGLNPNIWPGHVEQIALQSVGRNMVDYVSTVNRLYLAYQATEKARNKQLDSK
ncbi:transglycosylase SLT domain-containing protein [Chitinibacter sp. S2-10]|uniref:transglycosylase SLT domain-containing protein n=1 Tax=Chitinibacter sp. S2-10 TaxID=3373597 RepID=UPI00397728F9